MIKNCIKVFVVIQIVLSKFHITKLIVFACKIIIIYHQLPANKESKQKKPKNIFVEEVRTSRNFAKATTAKVHSNEKLAKLTETLCDAVVKMRP